MSRRKKRSKTSPAKAKAVPVAVREEAGDAPASRAKAVTIIFMAAALLAVVGLADAVYLTVEHLAGRSVPCTITGGCEQVLNSSYATVAGLPLSGLGALAYFTAFSLATLAAFGYRKASDLLLILVVLMLAVSVYLFILQAFVIKAFCQFCLLSAAITLMLALLVTAERFYFRRRR
ncbi:MAG TPA: vitamin K epoxide reductase family protein [Pyrinomonadaceae bacterium]|nr:vitamin K epoxide reductase family protein [Pyrinomonadaceae bacterium]